MKHILLFHIILSLSACSWKKNSISKEENLHITDLKILEIDSTNTEFFRAIGKIKRYLVKLNVPIDSMYVVGVDSVSRDEWKFRLIHYDSFLIQAQIEAEEQRIDSLEKAGVTDYYLNFIPPTGNWGGHDRTLVYSTIEHEIIEDLVDQ